MFLQEVLENTNYRLLLLIESLDFAIASFLFLRSGGGGGYSPYLIDY